MSGLVSVIIPVYNCEEYLEECLKSVTNQTYKKLEILLINDGSTDNSKEICDSYAQKDSRIKVIHQENKGVSNARNVGIQQCRGEYLTFVDADDELEVNAIEVALNYMEKQQVDVVVYGWTVIDYAAKNETQILEKEKEKVYKSTEKVICKILDRYSACGGGYPWNKLWHISSKNMLEIPCFNEDIFFFEDLEWVIRMMLQVECVGICPEALYKYYVRKNSITRNEDKAEDRELSYHQALHLIIANLEKKEQIQIWFKNKYYPELVNGVIDAGRKKRAKLLNYLINYLENVEKEIYNSKSITLYIKVRCFLVMFLKKLHVFGER